MTPVVSVLCATYNHEKFIAQALDGFLLQRTSFSLEILVHDDASTDGTPAILRDYEARHPDLIRVIYQTENQYSQGRKPGVLLRSLAKGIYFALCEGDDYWTDPEKLQRQVDFLEAHPEYVVTGHDARIEDDRGNLLSVSKLPPAQRKDFSGEDLVLGNAWVLTLSLVARNVVPQSPPEFSQVVNGDNFLLSLLGHFGKSHYHPEIQPAAYRVHGGGVWSQQSLPQRIETQAETAFWMERYYRRVREIKEADHYGKRFVDLQLRGIPTFRLLQELLARPFRLPFVRRLRSWLRDRGLC